MAKVWATPLVLSLNWPTAQAWRALGQDVCPARAGASALRSYSAGCLQPGARLY